MGICCHPKQSKETDFTEPTVAFSYHREPIEIYQSTNRINEHIEVPQSTNLTKEHIENLSNEHIEVLQSTNLPKEKGAIAQFSLSVENEEVITFSKGDRFFIQDDSDPEWYLVYHVNSRKTGFAPKTYLSLDINVGSEEWFFGELSKADAERLLFMPENVPGAFMIRNSSVPGKYALSLKCAAEGWAVFHHKIKHLDNGGYFLSKESMFETLQVLVEFYKEDAHGLPQKLEKACIRPRPVINSPLPDARDKYEIPYNSLSLLRQIGSGKFCVVFYGIWNRMMEVAIKRLQHGTRLSAEHFRKEVAVLKAINHPKIVRLFTIYTEIKPFCIVMEYMRNGNLLQYLKTPYGKQMGLPSLVNIAAQIADGMKYLESKKMTHRHLAARNILVGDGNVVKLGDFGLAQILGKKDATSEIKVAVKWTAPEVFESGEFTIKSDVWSFGIVLYEIFTHGETPYPGMKNNQVVEFLIQNHRMPKPTDIACSDEVYGTMLFCWKNNPNDRPTFEFLYYFFTDFSVVSEEYYWQPQ